MQLPTSQLLALFAFLSLAPSSVLSAAYANSAHASALMSSAITLPRGSYMLTNVATGQVITFNPDSPRPDIALSSSSSLRSSPHSHNPAIGVSSLGGKQIRLAVTDDNGTLKCFSAQWDARSEGGCNHAATLYACCQNKRCNNGSDDGPLRFAKQAFIVVPSNKKSVKRASQAGRKRGRAAKRDAEEEEEGEEAYSQYSEEYTEYWGEEDGEAGADQGIAKRGRKGSQPTYFLIPVDHLYDMKTRAVVGRNKKTAGNQLSLVMSQLKSNDRSQQWYIRRA